MSASIGSHRSSSFLASRSSAVVLLGFSRMLFALVAALSFSDSSPAKTGSATVMEPPNCERAELESIADTSEQLASQKMVAEGGRRLAGFFIFVVLVGLIFRLSAFLDLVLFFILVGFVSVVFFVD